MVVLVKEEDKVNLGIIMNGKEGGGPNHLYVHEGTQNTLPMTFDARHVPRVMR